MTQRSKFRLQRRGWGGFFADSFFPSFLSFRFFPRSILWPILALSVDEKKGGSQPKLIGIRERRLTWSFPWKKLWRTWLAKVVSNEALPGEGNPCLEKQISLPEELAIFESRKNPFPPLQNSPESVVRGGRSLRFLRLFRNLVEWHTGYTPFFPFFRFSFIRVDFGSGSDASRLKKEWMVVTWDTEWKVNLFRIRYTCE